MSNVTLINNYGPGVTIYRCQSEVYDSMFVNNGNHAEDFGLRLQSVTTGVTRIARNVVRGGLSGIRLEDCGELLVQSNEVSVLRFESSQVQPD
jgi:hypothetical protein